MPQTNDSVLVSAARDGQVRRHVISSCGHLMGSDKVAYHNDSAHKVSGCGLREVDLTWRCLVGYRTGQSSCVFELWGRR